MGRTAATQTSEAFLSLADVSKSYHDRSGVVPAIGRISVEIGAGEFVTVVGPSGSGKSTLLKLVAGLLTPTAGTICLRGRPITGPHPDIGMMFQSPVLLRWKRVLDNVLLPAHLLRLDRAVAEEKARMLLRLVGLAGFEHRMPYELSGGMQQRVALCRTVIHDPALLLMDEPFGALDELTREELGDYLQLLWQETGKTVLFVTHSIAEAVYLADRIAVLGPRPSTVKDVCAIDLPRPRSARVRFTPEYAGYVRRIRRSLGLAS